MTKFQNMETLTPVLLMKHLESPYSRDVRIRVNTVFVLISLKTEIARSVNGLKIQGPHAEDAMAEPYLVLKIFGDLITADHKVLSDKCESRNNHRYAVVVQGLGHSMDPVISVQNKNFSRNREELAKILGAR